MPYSYNGWYASPNLSIRPLEVAGESFVPGVLNDDDVYTVLRYVAVQLHERVEPIVRSDWHQMDDWGYNYRLTTNDNSLSCHSSGTAFDYNATRHPFGRYNTFTAAQQAEIHEIIKDLPIVWGGDYRNTPDDMHFEIMGSKATVAAAADRIRNGLTQEDDMQQADFNRISEMLDNKLKGIRDDLNKAVGQNTRIIEKLNKAAERNVNIVAELNAVVASLDEASPIRRKLNNVIRLVKEHDSEDETPTT